MLAVGDGVWLGVSVAVSLWVAGSGLALASAGGFTGVLPDDLLLGAGSWQAINKRTAVIKYIVFMEYFISVLRPSQWFESNTTSK